MNNVIDYKKIGLRIKNIRKEENKTQEQLCNTLNISPYHYSKIENGHVSASLETLGEIANYLNVSLDYVLLGCSKLDKNYLTNELSEIFNTCSKPQQQMIIEIAKVIAKNNI